jgi:hypothetical protein
VRRDKAFSLRGGYLIRALPVVIGLATILAGFNTAAAAERTRLDRDDGVRFHLDGRRLTVKLVPQEGHALEARPLETDHRLPRDISDVARWCLLETAGGGDVAYVRFRR